MQKQRVKTSMSVPAVSYTHLYTAKMGWPVM